MSETEFDAWRQEIAQLRDELHELRPATAISRRHALRSAGVVAAGALAGGIATIAAAGPAAAASGNFTGDPAVTADATTGTGIAATSVSGSAITASTSSQADAAIAATNPNWFGVAGTGTIGVVGIATSAGTAGVRGVANSTSSGSGGSFSGQTERRSAARLSLHNSGSPLVGHPLQSIVDTPEVHSSSITLARFGTALRAVHPEPGDNFPVPPPLGHITPSLPGASMTVAVRNRRRDQFLRAAYDYFPSPHNATSTPAQSRTRISFPQMQLRSSPTLRS